MAVYRGLKRQCIRGLKKVISGEISVEKISFEKFYFTKRFVFELQQESLELFLSSRAHFYIYDLGSLLPAGTVTVKRGNIRNKIRK